MRAYVATTGVAFALLVAVHAWRLAVEGRGTLDAFFVGVTLASAAMAVWAWRVWRTVPRTR